ARPAPIEPEPSAPAAVADPTEIELPPDENEPLELDDGKPSTPKRANNVPRKPAKPDASGRKEIELELDPPLPAPARPASSRPAITPPPPDARTGADELSLDPALPEVEPEPLPDDAILSPEPEDLVASAQDGDLISGAH